MLISTSRRPASSAFTFARSRWTPVAICWPRDSLMACSNCESIFCSLAVRLVFSASNDAICCSVSGEMSTRCDAFCSSFFDEPAISLLLLSKAGSLLGPAGVEVSRLSGWRSDLAKEPVDIRSPAPATSANSSSKAARNNFLPTEDCARPWRIREILIVESS